MRWLVVVLLVSGCSYQTIPYDLSAVRTAPRPVHRLTLAILPLDDGRRADEASDPDGRFIYRKIEYRGTQLDTLAGNTMWRLTEVVGQHVARTNCFSKVMLVLAEGQAPEADLYLRGRVLRARGYVEANAPKKDTGRPPNERHVLSEVAIESLQVTDRQGRMLMDVDVGWSTFGVRLLKVDEALDPWMVLADSMRVALTQLTDEVATADLSGGHVVVDEVALAQTATVTFEMLGNTLPTGWRFSNTSSAASPIGWIAERRCAQIRFEQKQTVRFHRALGPYRPFVDLWSCPQTLALTYDAKADFPARFLGERDGRRYFAHTIGRSNWPKAIGELTEHLAITPPAKRHVFELPGE